MNKLFYGNGVLDVVCDKTEADMFKRSLFVGSISFNGEITYQEMNTIFPE
jgi:hypothetical protein